MSNPAPAAPSVTTKPNPVAPAFLLIAAVTAWGFSFASGYLAQHPEFQAYGVLGLALGVVAVLIVGLQLIGRLISGKGHVQNIVALVVAVPLLATALRAQTIGALMDLGPREAALADARALMAHAASIHSSSAAPATPALSRGHFGVQSYSNHVRLSKFSVTGPDYAGLVIVAPGFTVVQGQDQGDGIYWVHEEYGFTVAPVGSR